MMTLKTGTQMISIDRIGWDKYMCCDINIDFLQTMSSYFNTTELNSALNNLSTKLTEKANVANLYPVLKKATSSAEDPTPGMRG